MTSAATPGPLNPGNVVSAALRMYRDRFKMYFGLSVRAVLWALVPVYGWAKYGMHTGLMSRIAFQELINQPETPRDAERALQPKMWSFLWLGLLLVGIFISTYLAVAIVSVLLGMLVGGLLGVALNAVFGPGGAAFSAIVVGLITFLGIIFGLLWVVSRVFISEVSLAMEPRLGASDSLGRSWQLTKNSVMRIQFVVLAAYLVTLPVIIVSVLPQLAQIRMEPGTAAYNLVTLLSLVISLAFNIAVLPFWQVVKGVLYYDLRSRREGLDLSM